MERDARKHALLMPGVRPRFAGLALTTELEAELMVNNSNLASEEWLTREDNVCRQDRLTRLNWLATNAPDTEYWVFHGGSMSKYLFEEARYCFVYRQFLATIVLGIAYIEHTLAALFYASGRNELERAGISILLQEALAYSWIDQAEFDNLQRARRIRNPITHFRRPLHSGTIEYRTVFIGIIALPLGVWGTVSLFRGDYSGVVIIGFIPILLIVIFPLVIPVGLGLVIGGVISFYKTKS